MVIRHLKIHTEIQQQLRHAEPHVPHRHVQRRETPVAIVVVQIRADFCKQLHAHLSLNLDSFVSVPSYIDALVSFQLWFNLFSAYRDDFRKFNHSIMLLGVSLLKVGGRMIYSTCSMNPIKNEAIVAEAISPEISEIIFGVSCII